MILRLELNGSAYRVDLSEPLDISIPVSPSGVTAWGVPQACLEPHREPGFTGSIAAGASVNFFDISFNPHAHGTHTECMGHINEDRTSVMEFPPAPWLVARLVSIQPEKGDSGSRVTRDQLRQTLGSEPGCEALVIRTLTNPESGMEYSWSGTHPAWLSPEAASWLAEQGIQHLLIDLPSVDPEQDGGALAAHKAFWGLPDHPRPAATITELILVPDDIPDGFYLLNLQLAAFENDACPSRPLLFNLIAE